MNFNDDFSNITVSLFIDNENKNRFSNDFNNFCKDKDKNFDDDSNNIIISLFIGIGNNINVYIVEVPNETAPSIQGFAKPPA